jgi:quinol monooxygenase YgiN
MTEPAAGPIHVVAVITGKPGTGNTIEPLLVALAEGTHTESGCLLYSLQRGAENPDQFTTVEKWTSGEALAAHMQSAHVQTALGAAGGYLAEPPLIIPGRPVAAGDAGKSGY